MNVRDKRLMRGLFTALCLALALQVGDANAKPKPKDCKKEDKRCAEVGVVIGVPTNGGLAIGDPDPVKGQVKGQARGLLGTPDAIIPKPQHKSQAAAPSGALAPMAALVAQPTINNRGFETVDPAAPTKALGWMDFWNGGYTRVSSNPPSQAGDPYALSVTLNGQAGGGGEQLIQLNQTQVSPIFIGGRVRGQNLVAKPLSNGWYWGAHIIAEFNGTSGEYVYCSTPQAVGTFGWRWIGFTSTNCQVNFPIASVWIEPAVELATGTAWFDLMQINAADPPQIGAVTIQFDDGWNTLEAETILGEQGLVGSQAVVSGWINQYPDNLSAADLQRMQGKGWDIMSHTRTHPYMTQLTDAQAKNQLTQSKTQLQGFGVTVDTFGWPYGDYNQKLVGFAQAVPYISTRGYWDGDNPVLTYAHDVRVRQLVVSTTLDQVRTWLQQAADNKRWVILGMHAIADTWEDQWYNTPAFTRQMAAMIKNEFVNTGKLENLNYRQAIQKFGVTMQ